MNMTNFHANTDIKTEMATNPHVVSNSFFQLQPCRIQRCFGINNHVQHLTWIQYEESFWEPNIITFWEPKFMRWLFENLISGHQYLILDHLYNSANFTLFTEPREPSRWFSSYKFYKENILKLLQNIPPTW